MKLNEYIDLLYNNFKDSGKFEDLDDEELSTLLTSKIKNLSIEILYTIRKNQKESQNKKIKELFKNIGILIKINDINLEN